MKAEQKKLLIISYYWPPSGGSGVQRWMYFAKYLKSSGWKPYILTVDENVAAYPVVDKSLLKEVASIPTIRTQTREPLRWYSRINTASETAGIPQGAIQTKSLFGKFAAFIRGNFFIPDARKGWRPYALKAAEDLIQKEGIQRVVTTGPPHSTHWVGTQLKNKFGLKWIVDLRDPWVTLFYNKQLYRTLWAVNRDRSQEKAALKNADAVLTTVAGNFHEYLKKIVPHQEYYAIPNGYDQDLINSVSTDQLAEFHVVYTGLLTENQNYQTLIQVLKQLQSSHSICLSLAGQIHGEILTAFKEELPNIQLKHYGYLPHIEAIRLMKSADLLLNFIFIGAQKDMISGKLLEYIATAIPILSIGDPNSEAGKFIKQGTAAAMFEADQLDKIQRFVEKAIKGKGLLKNRFPDIENWSREALTKRLERILL
ncbi:hypothetical protein OAN99_04340 [Flavobacteriaceae bacterium]|nr:hypothetical protein [Flavobacteriaceae bacterium]